MTESENTEYIIVYSTASSKNEAESIASSLIESKLAACVQIISGINSTYYWEGKVVQDDEFLLSIKTVRIKFEALKDKIIDLHSYKVPEIIALPVVNGSEEYLNWIYSTVNRN